MIHITKSGFKTLEWDSETRSYKEEKWNPLEALRHGVTKVEEDVNLGDIILLVAHDEMLRVFFTFYSSCPVDKFAQAVLDARAAGATVPSDVDFCGVSMSVEIDHRLPNRYKDLANHELTVSCDFHGIKVGGADNYGLSLSSVQEVCQLPFRLEDRSLVCETDQRTGSYQMRRTEDLHYCPSLLELLDAILFEISFHGSPEETAVVRDDLMGMMKEIEAGTAKTRPWRELRDELEQKESDLS
jgi:hypothetical protein